MCHKSPIVVYKKKNVDTAKGRPHWLICKPLKSHVWNIYNMNHSISFWKMFVFQIFVLLFASEFLSQPKSYSAWILCYFEWYNSNRYNLLSCVQGVNHISMVVHHIIGHIFFFILCVDQITLKYCHIKKFDQTLWCHIWIPITVV